MTTATEPTPSVAARAPGDGALSYIPAAAARLAALERRAAPPSERLWHACAYCHESGTTATGALWRVSPGPGRGELYYLHGRCLAPYKVAHGLRSVEGRLPLDQGRARVARVTRVGRRSAPAARMAVDRRGPRPHRRPPARASS